MLLRVRSQRTQSVRRDSSVDHSGLHGVAWTTATNKLAGCCRMRAAVHVFNPNQVLASDEAG